MPRPKSSFTGSINFPQAGQLTAGEWNDLNNWDSWNTLVELEDYKNMSAYWQIHPNERYSVFITNEENHPIVNAKVKLIDQRDQIIWAAMSDNSGKVELWNSLSLAKQDIKEIQILKNQVTTKITNPVSIKHGSNHISIDMPCASERHIDIAFVVDATGSMQDEISFLQSELADILNRLEEKNNQTSYRTASVFYKDHTEEYLTSVSPFNVDLNKTIDFIKTKSAGGGGDYEEAVEEGLKETLSLDWNPNAIARLAFLVLDAPPHYSPEILKALHSYMTYAASQGIKIIPITASGINRKTEFLMKYFSIITNGTYVFLTDDSGIGNSHLDPLVENYEIEKLNDLLVRLIENYGRTESCVQKNITDDPNIKVYPNPASEYINIGLHDNADKILIRSSSGKIVLQYDKPVKGTNKINLENLIGGMYTINVVHDEKVIHSKSIIIIN